MMFAPSAEPDLEKIRAAVIDAGFTPGEVTVRAGSN